jgi:hypothetical protein
MEKEEASDGWRSREGKGEGEKGEREANEMKTSQ